MTFNEVPDLKPPWKGGGWYETALFAIAHLSDYGGKLVNQREKSCFQIGRCPLYKPISSSSRAIWQIPHTWQKDSTMQSLHIEPCMPPRVRILALMAIVPAGTQKGIRAQSPVRDDMLQMVQGKQKYPRIHVLQSEKHPKSPVDQSLCPSTVATSLLPATGWWTTAIVWW